MYSKYPVATILLVAIFIAVIFLVMDRFTDPPGTPIEYSVLHPDGTRVTEGDLPWLKPLAQSLDTEAGVSVLQDLLTSSGFEAAFAKIHEFAAVSAMYGAHVSGTEAIAMMTPRGNVYLDVNDKSFFFAPEDAHLALPFHEGFAAVGTFSGGDDEASMAMTLRYINRDGTTVIPGPFEFALPFVDGIATVGVRTPEGATKYGTIDRNGAWQIPPKFDWLFEFSDGLAAAQMDAPDGVAKLAGFVDRSGEFVVTLEKVRRMQSSHHDGLALVWQTEGPEYVFVDRAGKTVISPEYDQVEPFYEGRAAVLRGEKWGYIDISGKEVIPPRYYQAMPFQGGMTSVCEVPEGYVHSDHFTLILEYEE